MTRPYSPITREACALLGAQVALARRERGMTRAELAERVGVSAVTMTKVERGDPSVRLGVALEAAAVLGVPLFHEDVDRRAGEAARLRDLLTLLPRRVRRTTEPDDDF